MAMSVNTACELYSKISDGLISHMLETENYVKSNQYIEEKI